MVLSDSCCNKYLNVSTCIVLKFDFKEGGHRRRVDDLRIFLLHKGYNWEGCVLFIMEQHNF